MLFQKSYGLIVQEEGIELKMTPMFLCHIMNNFFCSLCFDVDMADCHHSCHIFEEMYKKITYIMVGNLLIQESPSTMGLDLYFW